MKLPALGLLCLALAACDLRVAPVGTVTPDPEVPGSYVMNRALPQPDPAASQPISMGFMGVLGALLPQPWGTILAALGTALVAAPVARRGPLRALQQTVDGLENAKGQMESAHIDLLHGELAKAQDESAKRIISEMRP